MLNPKTFYLIDDDADDLEFFCEAMDTIDNSFICVKATNSEQTLESFKRHDVPVPDLIFLDLNMPVVDGRTFLSELKRVKAYASVPVIIYSTSSNARDKEEMLRLGAAGFVTKPHTMKKLVDDLTRVLTTHCSDLQTINVIR